MFHAVILAHQAPTRAMGLRPLLTEPESAPFHSPANLSCTSAAGWAHPSVSLLLGVSHPLLKVTSASIEPRIGRLNPQKRQGARLPAPWLLLPHAGQVSTEPARLPARSSPAAGLRRAGGMAGLAYPGTDPPQCPGSFPGQRELEVQPAVSLVLARRHSSSIGKLP